MLKACGLEISKNLRLMFRSNVFCRFEFDQNLILNQQINGILANHSTAFIRNRDRMFL